MEALIVIHLPATENQLIGFIHRYFQIEPVKPLFHCLVEPCCIFFKLKGTDKIISITRQINLSLAMSLHGVVEPDIQHMVKVDIRQYR